MKKNKGTSYGELMIVLLIVSLALFPILKISGDYLRTLVFAREMFVINSYLQSKYQMLIAYRNKWLEEEFTSQGPPSITEWFQSGNYCINFDRNTGKLSTQSLPCQANLISGKQIQGLNYYININAAPNIAQIKIVATSTKFLESLIPQRKYLEFKLDGVITKWHQLFQ